MISNIITFTSDFGIKDEWVAEVKGVILSINFHAEIYDITHNIPSYDIQKGSFVLQSALLYYPMGTHLAVVDPGVGSKRKAIAMRVKRGDILVGPDNGLLIKVADKLGGIEEVVEITKTKHFLKPVCPTFQARDVFAPVTAHLSRGESLLAFGKVISQKSLVRLPILKKNVKEGKIETEVIDIDTFGTARLNIILDDLKKSGLYNSDTLLVSIKNRKKITLPYVKTFAEVEIGQPLFLIDSSGYLSISINQGNAATHFKLKTSDTVLIEGLK